MGLINPALDLRESEGVLANHFNDRGLAVEDIHDQAALRLAAQRLTVGSLLISSP